jgi:hypothetical protein
MKALLALFLALGLLGCAAGPRPVLYPNPKVARATPEQQQRDVDECMEMAKQYVDNGGATRAGERAATRAGTGATVGAAGGAAAGAALGRAGRGAAAGAAGGGAGGFVRGLLHGVFRSRKPSKAYRGFVDHCLKERGYHTVGWQ